MASYKSIAPKDSEGNRRLLSKYGGGSKGPRQPYATGGAVKRAAGGMVDDEDDMPDDGSGGMPDMSAEGDSAPPRLDRPGRKMHGKDKGKDKKGGTNVNVIIMPSGGAPGGPPPPGGPMPPMMAGPPPGPPPGPPMPPPGAGPGGPPMGMHKNGGRVGRAMGGKVPVQNEGGGGGARGRLNKIKAYGK